MGYPVTNFDDNALMRLYVFNKRKLVLVTCPIACGQSVAHRPERFWLFSVLLIYLKIIVAYVYVLSGSTMRASQMRCCLLSWHLAKIWFVHDASRPFQKREAWKLKTTMVGGVMVDGYQISPLG